MNGKENGTAGMRGKRYRRKWETEDQRLPRRREQSERRHKKKMDKRRERKKERMKIGFIAKEKYKEDACTRKAKKESMRNKQENERA